MNPVSNRYQLFIKEFSYWITIYSLPNTYTIRIQIISKTKYDATKTKPFTGRILRAAP